MLVNIDKYYYTSKKEASKYMGMMSNVVRNNIVDLDLSEIIKRVGKKGCTFTRAILNGATRDECFVKQIFLGLDFDGTIKMEEFRKRCEEYRIPFLFTYKTFPNCLRVPMLFCGKINRKLFLSGKMIFKTAIN